MIKHLVMWRMKDAVTAEQKNEMKDRLEALNGVVPPLAKLEVGIDYVGGEASSDVSLISEFASKEDLFAYQVHPAYQEVVAFVKPLVAERRVLDYDC